MEIELKNSDDFIKGFIQGEYKEKIKINEVLEYIKNLEIWEDDVILNEVIKTIERILKK